MPAAGHHGGGAVQVRGAVKTLSCVFGSLRKEAGPTDFLWAGQLWGAAWPWRPQPVPPEALQSADTGVGVSVPPTAATAWDGLGAVMAPFSRKSARPCLPLARQDIGRSYTRGLSEAHPHPSVRRRCPNSASSCWSGTNSLLSTSLPQPPSALLAGVSEAKSGEGEN